MVNVTFTCKVRGLNLSLDRQMSGQNRETGYDRYLPTATEFSEGVHRPVFFDVCPLQLLLQCQVTYGAPTHRSVTVQ
jgi:hypothetical protein